ncbi:hypothetical protein FQR65_LT07066 [Abscondita terminalis]|nr:hypothetical protein FQR65_LT07066 [Abscondita terminalis]
MSKVILGGGISGLSAAHYLRRKFPREAITLLEASDRNGGWIRSVKRDGYIFEQGPRTIRPQGIKGANTLKLIDDIGLGDEVQFIPKTHPAALNRMVYVNGALHNYLRAFLEFQQNRRLVEDESIYDFVERRFGTEIADYAISPLICGICAGDAKSISVKFLMANLFHDEQKYGSITKGFINNMFKTSDTIIPSSTLYKRAKDEKWSVFFFKDGLESLPKQLEMKNKQEKVKIELNKKCTSIELNSDNVTLQIDGRDKLEASHLISSISAKKLSTLISGHSQLKELLSSIPFVTVCVINLHYKSELIKNEGFGFLVPPKENLPILGVIFDSCCFPCQGCTNLTVMMGGHWFNTYFGENPTKEQLLETALNQLEKIMEIKQKPHSYEINVLKDCIPQYVVGHHNTINKIDKYIADNKLPLSLCGTSYNGVGINDAIYSSKNVVDSLQNT